MIACDVSSLETRELIGFFQARRLQTGDGLVHAFATRQGGVSPPPFHSLNFGIQTVDEGTHVRNNREILGAAFGFPPSALLTVNQVHGDRILIADSPSPEGFPEASCDAVITDQPGLAAGVLTADCVPILLYAPDAQAIAAVHVGWRGTALDLCGKTIALLRKRFGADPGNLLVAVGPSIGPCCYEVDESVRSAFSELHDLWQRRVQPSASHRWRLDLPGVNIDLMVASGVRDENITWFRICTHCREDLFFSHRRDGRATGRQLSFIMLKRKRDLGSSSRRPSST